ncbi:short-chain dehydrogenase [Lysinibacillus sp. OF-1]|uniref:short-chain dehydrogenase n=1 Tax=Lysinibacillus sp. OF-1 TaxID=2972483 RepID=UPI00232DA4D6|nr:short-chain dehydrogenase [Lysinibacillus sp. OF-1]WCH45748.1 short-chain dehydrogenase [Lysinibacillus sp. OF-1]
MVIAWIHSYAETVLESIASEISGIWILGSSANLNEIKDKIHLLEITHYRQVQLGFIMENGQSRWLTHKEISQGVIDAIQYDRSINIVGTLQPWEQRPL